MQAARIEKPMNYQSQKHAAQIYEDNTTSDISSRNAKDSEKLSYWDSLVLWVVAVPVALGLVFLLFVLLTKASNWIHSL